MVGSFPGALSVEDGVFFFRWKKTAAAACTLLPKQYPTVVVRDTDSSLIAKYGYLQKNPNN